MKHSAPASGVGARPIAHYTPAKNWMNDPNGLVWYAGEYHLFYQYNPEGSRWGNMSWGHAVSRDLVHWRELPVAIPHSEQEEVFSGSVVVDKADTSGFGRPGRPAMVAIYTSLDTRTGVQAQSLAYSTDRGRTWTRYSRNPVLDLGSKQFRDPKVFWYDKGGYWVMATVLAEDHVVKFFRSDDLRSWSHLSDFGPANAVGGVWEMPDLFELPVDGDPADMRWVLLVSLNPGAVAGGSGTQYFVGDFDGSRFTAEDRPEPSPPGTPFASFDGEGFDGWTPTGTAFGHGPAHGSLPGQQPVEGFSGRGFASSFTGGDASTGRLTSPEFRIRDRYLNLLVGGGSRAETSVNLLVDGRVVLTATGQDTEALDWVAWHVGDLRGRRARIQVVDNRTDAWGHISVDEISSGATPALPRLAGYDWVDHGKDFYAATTYNDAPGGERVLIGWMSNWEYAADTPDAPWRGAMALPRRLELRTVRGEVRLIAEPVDQLQRVLGRPAVTWRDVDVPEGELALLPEAHGDALVVRARIDVGTAENVGLKVLADATHRTLVGYDAAKGRLYVDRTDSGADPVSPTFPGRQEAPLPATAGVVTLRVVLDRTSVEVFGGEGEAVITDQVFPPPGADGLSLFAQGGAARLLSLEVTPLERH